MHLIFLTLIHHFFFKKLKGANPVEQDSGRNLRADQWARFCGRHTTAEVIEQYARNKLLERNTSSKWSYDTFETNDLVKNKGGTLEKSTTEGKINLKYKLNI